MKISYSLKSRDGAKLGTTPHHRKLAKEKRQGALSEYHQGRFTNVGDLALKAVEQAIESVVAKDDLHFHTQPSTAHAERNRWLREHFSHLAVDLEILWGSYADLGYDGVDGDRAEEAVEAMERILDEIQKTTKIRFK